MVYVAVSPSGSRGRSRHWPSTETWRNRQPSFSPGRSATHSPRGPGAAFQPATTPPSADHGPALVPRRGGEDGPALGGAGVLGGEDQGLGSARSGPHGARMTTSPRRGTRPCPWRGGVGPRLGLGRAWRTGRPCRPRSVRGGCRTRSPYPARRHGTSPKRAGRHRHRGRRRAIPPGAANTRTREGGTRDGSCRP